MREASYKTGCFILSLLSISISSAVYAENETPVLDTMAISASRGENTLKEMPQSTTILTREDIDKSSAQTLDQLLESVPGFTMTAVPMSQSDPTGTSAKMRGLTTGSGKVLVLLDGVPIMDPFYMTTQWYRAPLANIDHIEVVRGGSPTWGSMAVAGVVNIISKHATDNSGEASAGVGSFHSDNESVSKNIKVSDALSFNITGNRYETAGYYATPTQYQYAYPGKVAPNDQDSNLHLSAFYKPSSDLSGFVRMGYDEHDQHLGYEINENLQKNPNLSAGLTKSLNGNSDITANFWSQYVNFFKQNGAACYETSSTACYSGTTLSNLQTDANNHDAIHQYLSQFGQQEYRETGASTLYTDRMTGKWNNVQFGADYRRISATDDETFYKTPAGTGLVSSTFATTHGSGVQVSDGVFAQTKVSPVDAMQITLAGRYDNWTYSSVDAQLDNSLGTHGGALPNLSKNSFDPTLGVIYDLNDTMTMRGSVYRTFRAPGLNNTLRSYGSSSSFSVANPNLVPETMTGGEVGTNYKNGGFTFDASYFYYDITNMIATYNLPANSSAGIQAVTNLCGSSLQYCAPTGSGALSGTTFYTNDQNGIARGFEFISNKKLSDNLTLNGSFTHTDTYLTSKASAITTPLGLQLEGVPENITTLGVSWKATDKLRTHVDLRYIGSMYIDNSGDSQGSNTVYNASAIYALERSMDIVGSVINLFNKKYTESNYSSVQSETLSSPLTINLALKVRFD